MIRTVSSYGNLEKRVEHEDLCMCVAIVAALRRLFCHRRVNTLSIEVSLCQCVRAFMIARCMTASLLPPSRH